MCLCRFSSAEVINEIILSKDALRPSVSQKLKAGCLAGKLVLCALFVPHCSHY